MTQFLSKFVKFVKFSFSQRLIEILSFVLFSLAKVLVSTLCRSYRRQLYTDYAGATYGSRHGQAWSKTAIEAKLHDTFLHGLGEFHPR